MARNPKPFGNPAWDFISQMKLTRENGLEAPVKANGKDGIVIGDPPIGVAPKVPKPGIVARLKELLGR